MGCSLLPLPNIVDNLETAHLTWKAYMEGYPIPKGCYNTSTSYPYYYGAGHNPFIFYADIQNNATRCSQIVAANSLNNQPNIIVNATTHRCWSNTGIVVDDDLFLNDLSSVATASNYMFLTPNTIDDNHDCNDVSVGNAWLQKLVPQILNSYIFTTQRAALFITFDEQTCTFPPPPIPMDLSCPSASPNLYAIWASNSASLQPTTRAALKSTVSFTHYSQLKTVEDNWHLPYLVASTDGSSKTIDMQVFFR